MLALGLLAGLLYDPRPARPIVRRGAYRVLQADFHAHTTFSDGSLSPLGVVRQAERRGLDAVALTEHNTVLPAKMARFYASVSGGPIVLVGEEVTTASFHVIALGLEETVSPNQPLAGVLHDIHAQRGLAIAAHPVKRYWPALVPHRAEFDGSEVMHPLAFSSLRGWRWDDMVAFYDEGPPMAAIGSSDYHWGPGMGSCRTLVFVGDDGDVLEAVRARHTVVVDGAGGLHGHPELVELVRQEPVPVPSPPAPPLGDRVGRVLGFLGMVGLVVFQRRRGGASS